MNDEREDDERDLAAKLAALPDGVEPRRDLWAGVAGRIESKRRRTVLARRSIAGVSLLLAAAAVVLVLRSGKHPAPSALHATPEVTAPSPVPSSPGPAAAPVLPEVASFEKALGALTPVFEERKKDLPPDGAAAIAKSLGAIDAAILSTRAAIAVDPADDDLRRELDSEYEQKIDMMNDVLDWTQRS